MIDSAPRRPDARPFSLWRYLLIVFACSWPFQLAFLALGPAFRPLLLVSMIMAGVATFVCGRYVFADGFQRAGWRWGRPRHYLAAFGLALFLWLVPVPLVFAISLIPTVMHAVVFAYVWARSGSLAVVTVYHAAFDEVRDTLADVIGLGPLAEYWQAIVLTMLGSLLVWKAKPRAPEDLGA